jgi:hypothetical protein
MGIASEVIDKVKGWGGLLDAFDFGLTDPGTLQAASIYGSKGSTITFDSGVFVGDDGVTVGFSQSALASISYSRNVSFVFFIKPTTNESFDLFTNQTYGYFTRASVSNLMPRFSYRGYSGQQSSVIRLNAISIINYYINGAVGPYSIDSAQAGGAATRDSFASNVGVFHSYNSGALFGDGFVGEAIGFLAFDRQLSQSEIEIIAGSLGAYGDIILPTNLEPARYQSGVALRDGRKIDGTFEIGSGTSELSYYSASTAGDLIQFYAFDTNEGEATHKTDKIDPGLVSELVFTAISGLDAEPSAQVSKVSGIVQIDGAPANRTVRAFGYDPTAHSVNEATVNISKSLGHATSDPETGEYTIDLLSGYGSEVFVVAFDDYGAPFASEATLAVGERIHPTTPNGHVWETTGAGTLPVDEPTWVVDTEAGQLYGTASMIARLFYRPMVHGPIMPEVTVPEAPALPTVIGEASNGGFYAGDISYGGKNYKLIVAEKAADVGGMPIMTPRGAWPGATSQDDGMANTLSMEGDARFIAAAHCLDYAAGGFSDWYLAAENEMTVIYNNLGHNRSPPIGFETGGNNAFAAVFYWTSTQASSYPEYNRTRRMSDGFVTQHGKDTTQQTRPVRRLEFTP